MAQHEGAAEGAVTSDSTPAEAFEALADEWLEEVDGEQQEPPATEEGEAEAELTEEDVGEEEAAEPPINPPASLTAEEKEAFKGWPRDAQEAFTRRVSDMERGFQGKSLEVKQAKEQAERGAIEHVHQLHTAYAEQYDKLAANLTPKQPDPSLIATNPNLYAQQMAEYQHWDAQRGEAQRLADQHRQQAEAHARALETRARDEFIAELSEKFPEYLDPASGAEHQRKLSSTAAALGYSPEQIAQANATDILAVRTASDWKAKADKYDALMAKKMERVRAAKGLPKVTRPGAASTNAQATAARQQSAWNQVQRNTRDYDAFADVLEASGVKL